MPIVSHVELAIERSTTAPGRIPERWSTNLKNEAEWLNEKRNLVIPDEEAYQARLADPAHEGYSPVISSGFWSRSGRPQGEIVNRHATKLKNSYKKWKTSMDRAFAEVDGIFAKRFKEDVDARQEIFSEGLAKYVLPFTGTKFQYRGPAVIAGYWLVDDVTVEGMLRAGDKILAGGPYLVCVPAKRPILKAALAGRLVQAGIDITDSGNDIAVMARHNQLTAEVVQAFVDPLLDLVPFSATGESHVNYFVEHGQLKMDVKVSKM